MSAPETNEKSKETENKVPDWLKAELFEKLLKENVSGYKKIKSFEAFPALSAGENYATIMLRIKIEVELAGDYKSLIVFNEDQLESLFPDEKSKSVSYMIKLGHDTEMYLNMLKSNNFFDIERGMYEVIVAEMEKMYRDVGLDVKLGAQCYELPIDKNYVVLEDLTPRGFKNINRLEGMDLEHTKHVLKKLALWHAASATRVETRGRYDDIYTYGFFKESQLTMMKQLIVARANLFLQCVKKYKGNDIYYESLELIQNNFFENLKILGSMDPNEFNVLNHGDFWSNNIMFQYDAFGKIKDVLFVDYQMPKYGSPAQDLYYFLISSTKLEIKIKQFDFFIKYYHDNLVEALNLLKYPKKLPSLKDIHIALYKYGLWGLCTATSIMGLVLLDPTDSSSLENFMGDSAEGVDFKMLMYSNPRFCKHAEELLPWLYYRGAFETP